MIADAVSSEGEQQALRTARGARRALVVYHSVYGNTRSIAEAIAGGLATAMSVEIVTAHSRLDIDDGIDLLVVGGPTHHRDIADRLELFVKHLAKSHPEGLRTVTFDTRYRGPAIVTGSAARKARKRLRKAGCVFEVKPESFFVAPDHPKKGKPRHEREHLEPGEVERARAWGAELATAFVGAHPAAA